MSDENVTDGGSRVQLTPTSSSALTNRRLYFAYSRRPILVYASLAELNSWYWKQHRRIRRQRTRATRSNARVTNKRSKAFTERGRPGELPEQIYADDFVPVFLHQHFEQSGRPKD